MIVRLILLIIVCLSSCIQTELLNAPEGVVDAAQMYKKLHKPLPPRDTTEIIDTARIPIGFNPTVEDWEE